MRIVLFDDDEFYPRDMTPFFFVYGPAHVHAQPVMMSEAAPPERSDTEASESGDAVQSADGDGNDEEVRGMVVGYQGN